MVLIATKEAIFISSIISIFVDEFIIDTRLDFNTLLCGGKLETNPYFAHT